jgi:hypothetical protein
VYTYITHRRDGARERVVVGDVLRHQRELDAAARPARQPVGKLLRLGGGLEERDRS